MMTALMKAMYSGIPEPHLGKTDELGLVDSVSNHYVEAFIKRRQPAQNKPADEIQSSDYFLLDNTKNSKKPVKTELKSTPKKTVKKSRKRLSTKERRILRISDHLKEEATSYKAYVPLQRLWLEYFRRVVDLEYAKKTDRRHNAQLYSQLLKADYHGCIVTITKSKCPSNVGTSGIVLQETRNVFKIVTKEDRLKTIPKENNVFTFVVDGVAFTLYGNQFRVKSSERAVRKFKSRPTISL